MPFVPVDDETVPTAAPAPVGYADDTAKGLARGVGRGVLSVPGMVGDMQTLLEKGALAARKYIKGDASAAELQRSYEADPRIAPTTEELADKASGALPGLNYQPQTIPGKMASTGAEFATGAALTGGRNAVKDAIMGGVAGLASETAGVATEGTAAEPYARGGAALLGGAATGLTLKPGTAGDEVSRALQGMGVTDGHINAAEQIFRDAQSAGIPMTWPQAISKVTGIQGSQLSNLQRIVEGQGGLSGHFAPTVEGIKTAGRDVIDTVAPASKYPGQIGPAIQEAASGGIKGTRDRINGLMGEWYNRIDGYQIPPQEMQQLMADPVYRDAVKELRTNPKLMRSVAGLPDNSVAFNDVVQRHLGEQLDIKPGDPRGSLTGLETAGVARPREETRAAMDAASGGEFSLTKERDAALREKYLAPLMTGTLGKLSKLDETGQAIRTLFPEGNVLQSEADVARAVSSLSNRSPQAAKELVSTYLRSTLEEAMTASTGAPNQWAGAGFRARVMGNDQQATNLRAAIRSLPGGKDMMPGIERFMDVLEATGYRQRAGSATAFNAEALDRLKRGGWSDEALKTLSGNAFSAPGRIRDAIENMRLSGNTKQLADLFTDPTAAGKFKALASAPVGSKAFMRTLEGLTGMMIRQTGSNEKSERMSGGSFVPVDDDQPLTFSVKPGAR